MEFFIDERRKQKQTSLLVLPFWEGKPHAESAANISQYKIPLHKSSMMQDFQGKEGELLFIYNDNEALDARYVLLGLGNKSKINIEKLRRAYAQLTKACHQKKLNDICLLLPETSLDDEALIIGVAEGLLLANYTFDKLKNIKKPEKSILLKKVGFIGLSKQGLQIAKRCATIAEGIYIARDLVNDNADDVTPQYLAQVARDFIRKLPVKATILTKKQIEKEKMDLLLAVNRGSALDPAVIILSYHGKPKDKKNTVLIGKGITYDTGGLNLKPVVSMETMKADMAGAAAILGTIYAAASLQLKVNIVAVIPATENCIDSKSFKPGDVYKSASGLTVEVNNPDAEGRLVLADAITYAKKKLHPRCIIDIATLTGGIEIALGSEACGLFTNNELLSDAFQRSGEKTFERVWRLPLYEEYRDLLKSDFADIKNSAGRSASSIVAAMFLQEFVADIPWAHLDIANVAYLSEKKRYQPKFATGFGVRLLIDFLSQPH